MKIYIKNMVCPRCIQAIEQIFLRVNTKPISIQLGEVLLPETLTENQLEKVSHHLSSLGFELLDDQHKRQIDKIKSIIIEHIHYSEDEKFAFTDILSKELHKEYSLISKLFSEIQGITIEQYVILQKIEKTKELLAYNELTLSEIAIKLGYSSVSHLSNQFKKVTGLTPSQFKSQTGHLRNFIDSF